MRRLQICLSILQYTAMNFRLLAVPTFSTFSYNTLLHPIGWKTLLYGGFNTAATFGGKQGLVKMRCVTYQF